MSRKYIVFFGSDRIAGRQLRRKVRQMLHRGIEPEPKYSTGKFWID